MQGVDQVELPCKAYTKLISMVEISDVSIHHQICLDPDCDQICGSCVMMNRLLCQCLGLPTITLPDGD